MRISLRAVLGSCLLLTALALGAGASSLRAAPPHPGATLRLVVAGVVDGRPQVGLEIALEPGWKTYWRTPGDAGIPPFLDWSKSQGLTGLELRFPAPVRFGEEGARSIGYVAPVILPIDVAFEGRGPATLDIDVQVGICHDICLPLAAHFAAVLDPAATIDRDALARLTAARALVPQPAAPEALPRVVALERDPSSAVPALLAKVEMPPETAGPCGDACDVLVEGPSDDWALPLPEKIGESGGRQIWRFALDGMPKGATIEGAELRFTLRARDRAVEQRLTLDAAQKAP